jgi:hypothetical protein
MSGTSASLGSSPAAGSFPAPRLRMRSLASGPVAVTLFDGNSAQLANPVEVVLAGVSDDLFAPDLEAEVRLFRYARAKSRSSVFPSASRWAALPHIEAGGNAYSSSGWLGGTPVSGGADRFSRRLLAGLSHGDVVNVSDLAMYWMRFVNVSAWQDATTQIGARIVGTTWKADRYYPSRSHGLSRNIEPVRFAVGFVGRNPNNGKWDLLSPLSKFAVANTMHPFLLNPDAAGFVSPMPAWPGARKFIPTPGYDQTLISARLTDSEWLAGR